ncbi:MAG: alanine dehydrogenase [Chloroflexota bacterium]|jgi:alanine dehydrogenase
MIIGIPRGRQDSEFRVGLIPAGVKLLVEAGHSCYVEHQAGLGSGYTDYAYQLAGGTIAYNGDEVYGRSDLILTISCPTRQEFQWMRENQILIGFLSLAATNPENMLDLIQKNITAIGYEIIQDEEGHLPVLMSASQAAGRMVPQIAAMLLQNNYGGKGILLGGVPGVPPAEVVILGAGTVGKAAARTFIGTGATVYVLDQDLKRLQYLDDHFQGRVITMVSHDFNLEKMCKFADVLVGAVLVPGARSPIIVDRDIVRSMRPRSIIIDISIDQGGCFETSRPTTHTNPTYIEEGIIHYCVPNMTSVLGRTATQAMNNAFWPYIQKISEQGLDDAIQNDTSLAHGVYMLRGEIVNPVMKDLFDSRRSAG